MGVNNGASVYTLTPAMFVSNFTPAASGKLVDITTDGAKFQVGEAVTYDSAAAAIKTAGSAQKKWKKLYCVHNYI